MELPGGDHEGFAPFGGFIMTMNLARHGMMHWYILSGDRDKNPISSTARDPLPKPTLSSKW